MQSVKQSLSQSWTFFFIDGDHTYEGSRMDFQMCSPLVRKGGLVVFHDICKHPFGGGCEVQKLWNEKNTPIYIKKQPAAKTKTEQA